MVIGAVGALAVAGGTVAWYSGWADRLLDQSNGAIAACEQLLVNELKAPSTYKRTQVRFIPAPPLTEAQATAYFASKGCPADATSLDSCLHLQQISQGYLANVALAGKLTDDPASFVDLPTVDRRKFSRKEVKVAEEKAKQWQLRNLNRGKADGGSTAYVSIQYDAANAFGTPIRSEKICHFGPRWKDRSWTAEDTFITDLTND